MGITKGETMRIGIDLGTTYSLVARINEKTRAPEIIRTVKGDLMTPSIIAFTPKGILFGNDAKEHQALGSEGAVSSFKREMGNNGYCFEWGGRGYSAEELSSMLLGHMIKDAEKVSGNQIDSAVITVPAYFDEFQRTATMRAGEKCGIKVLKIINEPTAASIFYGLTNTDKRKIFTYDLGGGTFDATIVEVSPDGVDVIGTIGNHMLGGKNWDEIIRGFISEKFTEEFGEDPLDDPEYFNELVVQSENYKKMLSTMRSVTIPVNYRGMSGKYTLSREEFEERTIHLVNATASLCNDLLDELGLKWSDIDDVLLVGGSTRMPAVVDFILNSSGKKPLTHADTDTAVAMGAAMCAEMVQVRPSGSLPEGSSKKALSMRVSDVTAHSLGALTVDKDYTEYYNEIMIQRNSKIPSAVRKKFEILSDGTKKIEIYTLQGESRHPLNCNVLAKVSVTDFRNNRKGAVVDVEYTYDENGVVKVNAYQDDGLLTVVSEPVPDDISWMGKRPEKPKPVIIDKRIVLAVDLSYSMKGAPLDNAKKAMDSFVNKLPNAFFGIIEVSDKSRITQKITKDHASVRNGIKSLEIGSVGIGNDTDPFDLAISMFDRTDDDNKTHDILVVLTDGVWSYQDSAIRRSQKCTDNGIITIAIGFGGADEKFLKEISSEGEDALLTSMESLDSAFGTIASAINEGKIGGIRR
jgi:molecular chaperone DnaK